MEARKQLPDNIVIVEILYGKNPLKVDLPEHLEIDVIRKRQMLLINDIAQEVHKTFGNPVGCEPLATLAQRANSACILLCDITRPVPNGVFIETLIDLLCDNGLNLDQITILIATGLHRPNEGDELIEVVGSERIASQINVVNHFARNDGDHLEIGRTTRETEVKIDRRFVDADLKIATGLVEPHFMAGYSGGRKVVVPGIAHADTIRRLHSATILEHPGTRSCNLEDNPLHDEQLQVLNMLRESTSSEIYSVNTVIDEYRRVGFINFGEIERSHSAAVKFAHEFTAVQVQRKYENILTSAGGYPLDQTYYQTVKGMVTPLEIAQREANLIVASECAEGLGSASYVQAQRDMLEVGSTEFAHRLKNQRLANIDEWETEMQLKAQEKVNIQLYSPDFPIATRELTGVELIDSIEDTIARNLSTSRDRRLAVIPEGPYVIPTYAN